MPAPQVADANRDRQKKSPPGAMLTAPGRSSKRPGWVPVQLRQRQRSNPRGGKQEQKFANL